MAELVASRAILRKELNDLLSRGDVEEVSRSGGTAIVVVCSSPDDGGPVGIGIDRDSYKMR